MGAGEIMTILQFLFGCHHGNLSFPQTVRRADSSRRGTYTVCLECGKEFPYDWDSMQVLPIAEKDKKVKAVEAEA
jgi:hypothetical protein